VSQHSASGLASGPPSAELPLRLEPVIGPQIPPISIQPGPVVILGRSSTCEIQLPDSAVSRRHASLQHGPEGWTIADLESRHGTFLNGTQVSHGKPEAIREGDVVSIGPWKFTVREGAARGGRTLMSTNDDLGMGPARVQRVSAEEVSGLAQQRLNLLMEAAAAVHSAADEATLADGVLEAALAGSGYTRAALLRRLDGSDKVEVVGQRGGVAGASFPLSRSLISAASAGQAVRLVDQPDLRQAQSIVGFGIEAAMCVPVEINSVVGGFLYLDSGVGGRAQADAAAFCTALARMCGLALANLGRRKMERLQAQLLEDLYAARETQKRIMPPGQGVVGPVNYAMKSVPGRMVAGDLFDIVSLGNGRVAAFLGDVSGKGVGAAMVMAAAQTELRAALRETNDVAAAVKAVNNYLVLHSAPHEFVTLWVGIFDGPKRVLQWVDAGHGYWLHASADGSLTRAALDASLIVGIDADHHYTAQQTPLGPGDRVVIYSDGVVEQASRSGEHYGMERTLAALEGRRSPEEDVEGLFSGLVRFAGTDALGDDVTIASIRFQP
jgi:sigma-B regulation protein RsbU (phosphoserine phosphatase)